MNPGQANNPAGMRAAAAVVLPPVLVFVLFVLVWESARRAFDWPTYLVPSPGRVYQAFTGNFGDLARACGLTAAAAAGGLAASLVLGALVAFAFSQSRAIQRAFYPYAVFLQTAPIVAVAPLLVIWFGTGFQSVVLASLIVSLFPVITTGTAGLTSVDRNLVELFRVHDASRWQVLFKLRLPNAIPYFATGAKTSSGLAVIGAVIGEFFVGYGTQSRGLGYYIIFSQANLKTDLLVATVLITTLLGLAIFSIVGWVGQRLTARWREEN